MRRRRAKSAVTLGTVVHQSPKQTQPSNKLYENRQTSHQQDRDRGHSPRHSQLNNNFIFMQKFGISKIGGGLSVTSKPVIDSLTMSVKPKKKHSKSQLEYIQ